MLVSSCLSQRNLRADMLDGCPDLCATNDEEEGLVGPPRRYIMQIVDDDGIDALTMRRLGRDLGVDPMMIYRHFSNKVAVLDGLMEVMWRDVTVPAAAQTTPSWLSLIHI